MKMVDRIPGPAPDGTRYQLRLLFGAGKKGTHAKLIQPAWWPKAFARVRINGEVRELSDQHRAFDKNPRPPHRGRSSTGLWPVEGIARAG